MPVVVNYQGKLALHPGDIGYVYNARNNNAYVIDATK
jgi:hypothetical protein